MWLAILFTVFASCNAAAGNSVEGQACTGKMLSLDPVCLGYSLTTCGTVGVYVNLTYQSQLLYEEVLKDAREYEQCQTPEPGSVCNTCVKFGSILVKPTYAKFCPQIVVTCTVLGKPLKTTQNLECIELGAACNASSCIECASVKGCGWCGAKGACLSSLRGDPYCDTCDKLWYPEDTCPRPPAAEGLSSGAITAVAVCVPLVIILCIGLGLFFFLKRRGGKHIPTGGPIELQDEPENYIEAPVTGIPVPDIPAASS